MKPQVAPTSDLQLSKITTEGVPTAGISWLWHLLNFSPFFLLVWFVSHFGVNVPLVDEWWFAYLFRAVRTNQATFDDFFAQVNEHRMLFPRLIWTPLAFATHWNLRIEMLLHVLLPLIVFAVFYQLALRQRKQTGSALFNLASFSTSLLVFSLVQYGNWLWAIGGSSLFVQAAFALAIAACCAEKLSPWIRFCLAALFCFIASFSSTQGLFSWPALLPCIAQVQARTRTVHKFYIWSLLFAASVALYSYHFRVLTFAGKDTLLGFLDHPLRSAGFFIALLGAPFCQSDATIPVSIALTLGDTRHLRLAGGVVLIALLGCLVTLRGYQRRDITAPWLSVALFGLLFAAMVTAGRSSMGLVAALQSRYITGTIFVPIAAIQLGRLGCVRKGMQVYLFLMGALWFLMVFGSMSSLSVARHLNKDISHAKLFVELVRYMDPVTDNSPESPLFPVSEASIRPTAELLNELDFLHLASNAAFVDRPCSQCGSFELAEGSGDLSHLRSGKDKITVSGWASLPGGRGLPKVVLMSYGDQKTFVTGAVVGEVGRPEIAARWHDRRYLSSGWTVSFPAKFLPLGEGILKAWVYDSAEKKFVRLPETGGEKKFKVETQ